MKTCIIPTFFCPVQTLCSLVPGAYFLFDVRCQKVKRPWRRLWTLHLLSRPSLMSRLRVLFQVWIIWKIAVIVYSKDRRQKMYAVHTFLPLDSNFSFGTDFLHRWLLLQVKKNKYATLSMQSKQFLLLFLFFSLKDWASKLNLRLSSILW